MSRTISVYREPIQEYAKGKKELEKSFLYVTFDIIEEEFGEVKKLTKGINQLGERLSHFSLFIYHCTDSIAPLSLHIGNDCNGVIPSKSAIRNSKSGIAVTMKT